MKSLSEINNVLRKVNIYESKYPNMTYEQGIEEALQWVVEEIPDEEFEFTKD